MVDVWKVGIFGNEVEARLNGGTEAIITGQHFSRSEANLASVLDGICDRDGVVIAGIIPCEWKAADNAFLVIMTKPPQLTLKGGGLISQTVGP